MNGRTVSVTSYRYGFPVVVRYVACSTHAEAVVARLTPPDYGDPRPDDRGGFRAVRRSPRTTTGPCERSGMCDECGAMVGEVRRVAVGSVLDVVDED